VTGPAQDLYGFAGFARKPGQGYSRNSPQAAAVVAAVWPGGGKSRNLLNAEVQTSLVRGMILTIIIGFQSVIGFNGRDQLCPILPLIHGNNLHPTKVRRPVEDPADCVGHTPVRCRGGKYR
jgi:hypothetical protein